MYKNNILYFFAFLIIGCNNTNDSSKSTASSSREFIEITVDIDKFVDKIDSNLVVDFRKIGTFESVFIYGPYEGLNSIEKEFNSSFHFENKRSRYIDDSKCLVVFKGEKLDNNYFFISRAIDISQYSKKHFDFNNSVIIAPLK